MEIEELWFAKDTNMPQYELELKRLEVDGELSWRFSGRDSSDNYGEHHVDVDRKHLKDLHSAIEHELYPERFIQNKLMDIAERIWTEKPTECPVCDTALKIKYFSDKSGECVFCPKFHGQTVMGQIDDQVLYRWYMFPSSLHKNG